ncbi:MAG: Spherulation-specific family 4 [Monoraphidium minutum]|nr:MAG: Spherulation-specific family 4 [Monoraphidium minutum]
MVSLLKKWLFGSPSLEGMELMVPWYVWPGPAYDELIAAAEGVSVKKSAVVVGGTSGPGPERPFSQMHLDTWRRLKDAGWLLYGYVHCARGERPLHEITADVDSWVELYGDVIGGIFVDEMLNSGFDKASLAYLHALVSHIRAPPPRPTRPQLPAAPTCCSTHASHAPPHTHTPAPQESLAYFQALVSHIRGPGLRVALNPGTELHDGGAIASQVDVVVGFEASHDTWRQLPRGFRCRCGAHGAAGAAVVHSFAPPAPGRRRWALAKLMAAAKARGFTAVFITDAGLPNPYDRLPAFWAREVACFGPCGGGAVRGRGACSRAACTGHAATRAPRARLQSLS